MLVEDIYMLVWQYENSTKRWCPTDERICWHCGRRRIPRHLEKKRPERCSDCHGSLMIAAPLYEASTLGEACAETTYPLIETIIMFLCVFFTSHCFNDWDPWPISVVKPIFRLNVWKT